MPQKFLLWLRALSVTRRHDHPVIIVNSLPVLLLSSSTSRNSPPVLCSQSKRIGIKNNDTGIVRSPKPNASVNTQSRERATCENILNLIHTNNFGAAEWKRNASLCRCSWISRKPACLARTLFFVVWLTTNVRTNRSFIRYPAFAIPSNRSWKSIIDIRWLLLQFPPRGRIHRLLLKALTKHKQTFIQKN